MLRSDFAAHRDELVISTKAGYRMWPGPYGEFGSRKYILASLDQSLKRMGIDYVDIFYSHRFDPKTPLEETMGALDTAVRQGKTRWVAETLKELKPGMVWDLGANTGLYSRVAREAGVVQLTLIHLDPQLPDHSVLLEDAAPAFDRVSLGVDEMVLRGRTGRTPQT